MKVKEGKKELRKERNRETPRGEKDKLIIMLNKTIVS